VSTPNIQLADPVRAEDLDRILDETGRNSAAVIAVLQGIQARYRYLPEAALRYVCDHSEITPAAIVGVSTFYTQFRHTPAGRHTVSVCVGTACHVKGASGILAALRRHLKLADGADTDADRRFTLREVNCLGCCTLAPVVQVDSVIYGYATPETVGNILQDFLNRGGGQDSRGASSDPSPGPSVGDIRVGMGSCCVASGASEIEAALHDRVSALRLPVRIQRVGCLGLCYEEPVIEVAAHGRPSRLYTRVKPEDIPAILTAHFPPPSRWTRLRHAAGHWVEQLYTDAAWTGAHCAGMDARDPQIAPYLDPQVPIATEGCGQLDPLSLSDYCGAHGFEGFQAALRLRPEDVVRQIADSGLRGRGGGGYPTGRKWGEVAREVNDVKYVVCNGDEGDPGAFMDRMLLESFPYRIIEGMLIAGYAVGATQGVLYIRAEYPLAIRRVSAALDACRAAGWLGPHILGSDFSFELTIMTGAGAFVCGEETALIASIEGKRGMPRMRPPYPSQCGLHGRPTLVNNTETFALISWILRHGPAAFAAIGSARSRGTKVFALAGKVRRGGLIEVPMGMTIRRVIDDIGGGIADGRRLKAVQIGGPSGGCIPERLADTPIDYEALVEAGAMMGSGGLVALDDADCMVEIARFFLAFTQHESCGKCTFCRIGTTRMLDILERLCGGTGKPSDLDELERLASVVKRGSLCGLGKSAPNPVLTTLRYFREEYEAHAGGVCPAGQCKALISYQITDDCIGCTRCAQQCPVGAIPPTPYERHAINPETCVRCDGCRTACPAGAVVVMSGNRIVKHGYAKH